MTKLEASEKFHRELACSLIRASGGQEEVPIKYIARVTDLGEPFAQLEGEEDGCYVFTVQYRNGD